jgi:hypothetical protein
VLALPRLILSGCKGRSYRAMHDHLPSVLQAACNLRAGECAGFLSPGDYLVSARSRPWRDTELNGNRAILVGDATSHCSGPSAPAKTIDLPGISAITSIWRTTPELGSFSQKQFQPQGR